MDEKALGGVKRVLLILFRILFTFFALWTTWFIFSNSMEAAALSSARSGELLKLVNEFLGRLGMEAMTSHQLRKLAHFAEFGLLGMWFMLCLRVYTRRYLRHVSWPLLIGLVIANVDETIQIYVSGRASSVIDVWIDFAGVCCGVLGTLLLLMMAWSILYLMGFGRKRERA